MDDELEQEEHTWEPWYDAFLATLRDTGNVRLACSMTPETSRATAYRHRAENPAFADGWSHAMEDAADVLEQEARRRAVEGVEQAVYHQGMEVGSVTKYSDPLLIFLLKGARPGKYREKLAGLEGTDGNTVTEEVTVELVVAQPPEAPGEAGEAGEA